MVPKKNDIIRKTDLYWEYRELSKIHNAVLKSDIYLKYSNEDSITLSCLPKSKYYVYLNQSQCFSCLHDALNCFSGYKNYNITYLINYNDKKWLSYIVKKYSITNYYYSNINIVEEGQSNKPFIFMLSKKNLITNPFILSKNELFNRAYLDVLINSTTI
jgi:hypothetical protein